MPRRDLHAAFVAHFGRTDVSADSIKAICTRKGWKTGRTGCFVKGQTPVNKGKKMPFHPNSARTRFKKGQRPQNTKKPGDEYVSSKDGYVYLCVPETNPHTGFEHRFVLKHKYLWEQKNGPVPAGHCLKSRDGNRQNTDPSNWMCIPRSMLPRLSGRWTLPYDQAPDELKPLVLAAAQLKHTAKSKRRAAAKGGAA